MELRLLGNRKPGVESAGVSIGYREVLGLLLLLLKKVTAPPLIFVPDWFPRVLQTLAFSMARFIQMFSVFI